MKRSASAVWFGDLRTGDGSLTTHSGALDQAPYSFANRFGEAPGNNYAGIGTCDSCPFGYGFPTPRDGGGFKPARLSTQAVASLEQVQGSWTITASHLEMQAAVPASPPTVASIAADAKSIARSRAPSVQITLDAQLEGPLRRPDTLRYA
jgi:osmotically inducible protein OsmC